MKKLKAVAIGCCNGKKNYKSLLESLEKGLIEVQRQVAKGELFLQDMLI